MNPQFKMGVLSVEDLQEMHMYPSEERMRRGKVAVAECVEPIPCNPCESSCKFGAICIGENITNLPTIDENKCTGCSMCVAACSGLAIFLLDKSYSETMGSVAFPFEYENDYKEGDEVDAVDRMGRVVCRGTVLKAVTTKASDRTCVITLEVPIDFVDVVRGIKRQ